jgi:hypothetical protein
MPLVVGIPPVILNLIQEGILERTFHDGLYPKLQFRAEALAEEWPANTGTEMFMTRPGLLTPITDAITPGVDPTPQVMSYEQWVARLSRYAGTIDTHMPTSAVANANVFLRNVQQLGLQAGQSVNRIARNELFHAYLSGHTVLTGAAAAGDAVIQVASVNGFTDVILLGTNARPETVSPVRPLPVTIGIGAGAVVRNVIGFVLVDPTDPYGPGTLLLDAAVGGAGYAARTAVVSAYAPRVIRAGGGASVDAITAADTFVFQLIVNAMNYLRTQNVPPHADGFYHAHIGPMSNAQIFNDTAWQRLHQACPDHVRYKEGFLGTIARTMFYENTEVPDALNAGSRIATGVNAFYSKGIGAETTNEGGLDIGRVIVTGRGSIYEKYLDEAKYVSEAGITGKVGDFDIVQNGTQVATERIRLILRSPMDRLQDIVSATWSLSTCFPTPSDISGGAGPERFKRACIIEHAL